MLQVGAKRRAAILPQRSPLHLGSVRALREAESSIPVRCEPAHTCKACAYVEDAAPTALPYTAFPHAPTPARLSLRPERRLCLPSVRLPQSPTSTHVTALRHAAPYLAPKGVDVVLLAVGGPRWGGTDKHLAWGAARQRRGGRKGDTSGVYGGCKDGGAGEGVHDLAG